MTSPSRPVPAAPRSGIDVLLADCDRLADLRRRRVGALTNAACRTADGTTSARALDRALARGSAPGLACLFAPEHGFAADAAAGATVADNRDASSGRDVISLYGARQVPTAEHFAAIDTLIVDLRDVGVRCYTYAATAALAAAAALDAAIDVIVCDRPNPLGPATDGPNLDPDYRSFLAYFAVPFVHGRTLGDLVAGALAHHARAAALTVIAAPPHPAVPAAPVGDWIAPSPALQSPDAVQLYPGLVLFEATNLSEGRGTPLSFRCIGAPWLDAAAAADAANGWPTGVRAAADEISPTAGDYAGQRLPAIRFETTDTPPDGFGLGVHLLAWLQQTQPAFAWRRAPPPGPGTDTVTPRSATATAARRRYVVDTLLGSASLRTALGRGDGAEAILARWRG